jgi:protein-S-isoprenylcysteine O-methyltransferase Ste14
MIIIMGMTQEVVPRVIPLLWLTLLVVWLFGAARAKRTIVRRAWTREIGVRLVVIVLVAIALRNQNKPGALIAVRGPVMVWIGFVTTVCGIGLAILARWYLGRNWGMPGSRKENPDLITTGPYRVIRHPIYSGILLALAGTAMADNLIWAIPLVIFVPYFLYNARREERIMLELFPAQYPAYKKRTKMLVPFVL